MFRMSRKKSSSAAMETWDASTSWSRRPRRVSSIFGVVAQRPDANWSAIPSKADCQRPNSVARSGPRRLGSLGSPRQEPYCATPRPPSGVLWRARKADGTSDADREKRLVKGKAFPLAGALVAHIRSNNGREFIAKASCTKACAYNIARNW